MSRVKLLSQVQPITSITLQGLQIDGGPRLDLTQKLDPTHESGPALQIWAKNNGPF